MENFLKGENLYLYRGIIYNSGGGNNNNGKGSGGGCGGGCGNGNNNNPWERLWREPREILPTEKGGIPLGVFNIKGNISGGNKSTL